jgi:hypothetical protein
MKRTLSRPQGPAIVATTAHPSATRQSTRNGTLAGEERPVTGNRITLTLLENYGSERARGYDPYNASASPVDIQAWKRRQRRG